jgi:hypothetical protein
MLYACNRGMVFSTWSVPRCYKQGTRVELWQLVGAIIRCWKGAAIKRGLEPGSRGIAIVKSVTRKWLVKLLQAGKDLACTLVICKVSKLTMAL